MCALGYTHTCIHIHTHTADCRRSFGHRHIQRWSYHADHVEAIASTSTFHFLVSHTAMVILC